MSGDGRPPAMPAVLGVLALAGAVDAFSYLRLGHVYLSFMSGNSITLGISLADHALAAALEAAGIVGCFLLAVVLGTRLGRLAGRWHTAATLSGTTLLLALGAVLPGRFGGDHAGLLPMAGAMGLLNTSLPPEGRGAGSVTYVTGVLVRIGRSLATGGWRQAGAGAAEWLALVLGAGAGALAERRLGLEAVALLAAAAALGTLLAMLPAWRGPWRRG